MYNPFAPLNLFEIISALVLFIQTTTALSISLLVANGFTKIDGHTNAAGTSGGEYIPVVVCIGLVLVCLWTGSVWASIASGMSGAMLISALFNRARFLDDVTSTINTRYVNYAWLIIPFVLVLIAKWFPRIQIPLATSACGVFGFVLAFMPYRVVWTDNFVLVWSTFILFGWQFIYTYILFPFIVEYFYNRQLKRGYVSPSLQLVAISMWGDQIRSGDAASLTSSRDSSTMAAQGRPVM